MLQIIRFRRSCSIYQGWFFFFSYRSCIFICKFNLNLFKGLLFIPPYIICTAQMVLFFFQQEGEGGKKGIFYLSFDVRLRNSIINIKFLTKLIRILSNIILQLYFWKVEIMELHNINLRHNIVVVYFIYSIKKNQKRIAWSNNWTIWK